jgi:hypothetical protein
MRRNTLKADVVASTVAGTVFGFYTEAQVRALGVKEITRPDTFDTLGNPAPNGLYDRALGPVEDRDEVYSLAPRSHAIILRSQAL